MMRRPANRPRFLKPPIGCAPPRAAPKARGIDYIRTLVLTGDDKGVLADEMELAA